MLDEAGGATPLERAVFYLQDKLQEASLLEGRPGAIEALLAVVEFLSSISSPGDLQHQQSINSLISALMSLDDGEVLPLLKPARHPGRPRNSVAKEHAKAKVVWVVKRLCETGMDTNEAYKRVALVCRRAGMNPGRRGARNQKDETTARTVRGWHEAISADVRYHSRAGRQFWIISNLNPPLRVNNSPDALLKGLRRFLADMGTA
jgi:hypothetical protein